MTSNNGASDVIQGLFGVAEYLPYILIVIAVSIIFLIVAVWTGAFSSLAILIGNAFWSIIGLLVFVVGAILTYDNLSKHRRPERERAVIYSVIILVVLMLVLVNLPSIVYTVSSTASSAFGKVSHLSQLSFPITVANPGFAASAFGSQTVITKIGQPEVYPNAFTFSIPTLGILTNSVYIHATAVCNDTLTSTYSPTTSDMVPSGFKIVSTSSTKLTVSTVSGGTQTVDVNMTNIPDSGYCYYFFSLSGPNVNTAALEYFYNIQTGTGG